MCDLVNLCGFAGNYPLNLISCGKIFQCREKIQALDEEDFFDLSGLSSAEQN